MSSLIRAVVMLATSLALATAAQAEAFPSKPVKIVVNFAVGGPADLMARVFAERLGQRIKQPVIVEAIPGANGNLGARAVARASADGYTLLLTAENALTVSPLIYSRMGFDPRQDLDPVSLVGVFEQVLVVGAGRGIRSVSDLVAKAKAGPFTYASAGIGSPGHLAFLTFADRAGIAPVHVAYKGGVPAVTDLLGGQVDSGFVVIGGVRDHLQSGRLLALAVSGLERSAELPLLPTLSESGYPGFSVSFGYLMMLPKGASESVRRFWQEEMSTVLKTPEVAQRLKALDTRVINADSAAARAWIEDSSKRWQTLLRGSGIKPE